jgi:hypothetical protein
LLNGRTTLDMGRNRKLRPGDLVEIRGAKEIAETLDASGDLDRLPFMAEMLRHCGQRFRVAKRAHKTCDTVWQTGLRRMERAVHLEGLRCDGGGHGGCQAGCLLFWKEAWLRRVDESTPRAASDVSDETTGRLAATLQSVATLETGESGLNDARYRCQATRMYEATTPIARWDLRHFAEDLTSGNVRLGEFFRVLAIAAFDGLQRLRGGRGLPRFSGGRLDGATPSGRLDLDPGETVRVRDRDEIAGTLDTRNRNRGLFFDSEMVPYCGEEHPVERRVERIIDERTGRMIELKNPCIVLEGVVCRSWYSIGRRFCPRAITPYWRELWLERVDDG